MKNLPKSVPEILVIPEGETPSPLVIGKQISDVIGRALHGALCQIGGIELGEEEQADGGLAWLEDNNGNVSKLIKGYELGIHSSVYETLGIFCLRFTGSSDIASVGMYRDDDDDDDDDGDDDCGEVADEKVFFDEDLNSELEPFIGALVESVRVLALTMLEAQRFSGIYDSDELTAYGEDVGYLLGELRGRVRSALWFLATNVGGEFVEVSKELVLNIDRCAREMVVGSGREDAFKSFLLGLLKKAGVFPADCIPAFCGEWGKAVNGVFLEMFDLYCDDEVDDKVVYLRSSIKKICWLAEVYKNGFAGGAEGTAKAATGGAGAGEAGEAVAAVVSLGKVVRLGRVTKRVDE